MEYLTKQWKKYDLLFSKGNKIKTLSILTRKIGSKYVTIYFTSIDKLDYPYGDFVLINQSINQFNPFNNKYFMIHYMMNYYKNSNPQCSITEISSDDNMKIAYIDILIRYYSILSYYNIAQAIPDKFPLPFE